jgi:succinylarginine dihydrolase
MTGGQWMETQWDGLVGPTHHYAGLSHGNVASQAHALSVSHPRQAALQGLEKMRLVAEMGIPQYIVPPHVRPNLPFLGAIGFTGTPQQQLVDAAHVDNKILSAAWSASCMWTANMATVTPALDSEDGRLHVTPANLCSTLHRPQEAAENYAFLRKALGKVADVHAPLPACAPLADEGAANHMRLCGEHGQAGVEVWVYGKAMRHAAQEQVMPQRYPARQTLEACEALARLHHVPASRAVFVKQSAQAIDAGVFHNDVIAMSNCNVLIYHEKAFDDTEQFLQELREKLAPVELYARCITETELPLEDAVKSYFFNSQLLSLPEGGMAVVAPSDCLENPFAKAVFDSLLADNVCPITAVHYPPLRESMKNGGGPACLRLRIVMDEAMRARIPQGVRWSPQLHEKLLKLVGMHYRENLMSNELQDVDFMNEALGVCAMIHEVLFVNIN